MRSRLLVVAATAFALLIAASRASASSSYPDGVTGIEVLPITSTLGTFTGVAVGPLPGRWRVQIAHQPLRTGPSVAITGGSFIMHTLDLRTLDRGTVTGVVTGGSVTVVNPGARCTDQVYTVDAALTVGRFTGTLTHHRRVILGRCVIYAATITGRATLTA